MMKMELNHKRKAIIAQAGHLLVIGGPGSGKTTIALFKAQKKIATLKPGQEVLFLSFSRAAIRQVLLRCKEILTPIQRQSIVVQTYHAFCMDMLKAHGRLLHGRPIRFHFPGEERLRKSEFAGDWNIERQRQAVDMGLFCFDLFAEGTANLLEGCAALRGLIADRFPMIIVDEFQDTDNNQWRIVKALTEHSDVFCLADPDQRIFDYREDVDPRRLDILRETVAISEYNLGSENHRSPNAGIIRFADAILRNQSPLPITPDVKLARYRGNSFQATVHAEVIWMFSTLRRKGVENPSVAVLCRSNSLVSDLSAILSEPHTYNSQVLPIVEHDVVWDAELSAAAAVVVASILEWRSGPEPRTVSHTLRVIADFYKLKNAVNQTKEALESTRKYVEAAVKVDSGGIPRIKAVKELIEAKTAGIESIGDPVVDWTAARQLLQNITAFQEIFKEARLVRLFRATDALASGLSKLWLLSGNYDGASDIVKRILEQERLVAAERDSHRGCILMNMHKSKGKEFDGVVLVEGAFKSTFFDEHYEQPPYERSRRLLRVGLTRARTLVTIVRPQNAPPLVA